MKKIFGFSLIELLISLIVISCITAAFTPLITKKFSSGVFGGGSVSDITTECSQFTANCTLCTSNFCIACTGLSCGADEFKDDKTCTCKKCSEKYGADCPVCNASKCLTCPNGQFLDENEQCVYCSTKFNNCATCDSSQCTSCNSGYVLVDPSSSNPCASFTCPSPDFMQIDDLCVTAKNMGDSSILTIPDSVNNVSTGVECNATNEKCCWSGNSANQSACNEENGNYSGCNRTVCNWSAADEICKNFNYAGLSWRLATDSEMANWDINSIDVGANGLQLCDSISGYLSPQCASSSSCVGAYNNTCNIYSVWNSSKSSSNTDVYNLNKGVWSLANLSTQSALSVRCVAKHNSNCKTKFGSYCESCSTSSCVTCSNTCPEGQYLDTGNKCTCTDCKEKYGEFCTSCNAKQCLTCSADYKLSDNPESSSACEPEFTCSGEDFMQIGNLCITRKNMGDSVNLPIASGVNIKQINQSCSPSSSNKCCWQGNTSGSGCDNANGGGYSGCNRTVCDWWAADYICKNFHAGNYTWRLATKDEMSGWANNSKGKGTNGLQLCDYYSGYSSAYCNKTSRCPGANGSYCYPRNVWSGSVDGSSSAYGYYLRWGSWLQYSSSRTRAFSVRCVTNL